MIYILKVRRINEKMGSYRTFLRKIAQFQVNHPHLVIAIILVITIIMQGSSSRVRTVASFEQMMPTDVAEIKAFNTLRDNGMGQDIIAVIISVDRNSVVNGITDIRNKDVYDYIEKLNNDLINEPDVLYTYSYLDFLPKGLDERMYNSYMNSKELKSYLSQFINSDFSTTMILLTTDVSADDPRMNLLATKVKEIVNNNGKPKGTEIRLTGTPIVQQKLGELIATDRTNTKNISTLLVFLITMILFGTFTSALVPIIIVTISITWLYGIMGYFDLPISTLAGGVAAMVIGIGIDYAIHLMNKFKNERKNGLSIKEAIETAVENTGTALTGAAIATIVAFLAFIFGSMPEMNRFGLLMAIGVGSAFVLSIFGLPSFLIVEEKIINKLKKRVHFGVEGEFMLCEHDDIKPETHEEVKIDHSKLKEITKRYKVLKRKK